MTMKITLACASGMSTSILCQKIVKAAEAKGYKDVTCNAYGVSSLKGHAEGSSAILLGPQVAFQRAKVEAEWAPIPVMVIKMQDYGMMNGKNVFDAAEALMKEKGII
jgi:PTS system cellobiose-specific IIB component